MVSNFKNKRIHFLYCFIILCSCKFKTQTITDDQKHFLAGHLITAGSAYTMNFLTDKPGLSILAGCLTGIAAGIGKELIYDKYLQLGHPDKLDAITTTWGSLNASISIVITIDLERKNKPRHFLHRK